MQASGFNTRSLQSARAIVQRLYPGDPVPVYTDDPEEDLLMQPVLNCPSHIADHMYKIDHWGHEFEILYPQLLQDLRERTGFVSSGELLPTLVPNHPGCLPQDCPGYLVWWAAEDMQSLVQQGFAALADPVLMDHYF